MPGQIPPSFANTDPLRCAFEVARGHLARIRDEAAAPPAAPSEVVIFGCGHLGGFALQGARNAGLKVLAFADNDPAKWGKHMDGIPIVPPAEAVARYNHAAAFVVAIYCSGKPRQQLAELGCARILPYPAFHRQCSAWMPFEDRLESPDRVMADPAAIQAGYAALCDDVSRLEFAAQIEWRCTLNYDCLPAPRPLPQIYFDTELVRLEKEVLVDCGAFDGDTIRVFLDKVGSEFEFLYALEPDALNRARLEAYIASLPENIGRRCAILPYGASDHDGRESFEAMSTTGIRLSSCGAESIEVRRLDAILDGPAPTFIKMDIEGAEPEALEGAKEVVHSARPILAVCAYHKCHHLWQLPVILKRLLPEYHVLLRRYADECWETVYYAIPPERIIPRG